MSTGKLNHVCDTLCDCVRCHTESINDDNDEDGIDSRTLSETTKSQYSQLVRKHTENILTRSKPINSCEECCEDINAPTAQKEYQNNSFNSNNSTTNINVETIIDQEFNTNYSSTKESDLYVNSMVDRRALKRYFNIAVVVSLA